MTKKKCLAMVGSHLSKYLGMFYLYCLYGFYWCCSFVVVVDMHVCVVYTCVNTASSGSVTINSDGSVQILAEEAAPLEDFDIQVSGCGHSTKVFRLVGTCKMK